VRKTDSNNGPPNYPDQYYYVHQYRYNWPAEGSPNATQFAIPYTGALPAWRTRQSGTWGDWKVLGRTSAIGRDLMIATDKAAARIAIGAGTSNLALGTTATTAKPGNWKPNIDTDTQGQLPYSRLTDVPSTGPLPNAYAVGSYVLGHHKSNNVVSAGTAINGSQLGVVTVVDALSASSDDAGGGIYLQAEQATLSGTWRAMMPVRGTVFNPYTGRSLSLLMRIA